MKLFSKLLSLLLMVIFIGCNSSDKIADKKIENNINLKKICPQCNMPLPENNKHTSYVIIDGETNYFDDIGCAILWAKKNNINLLNKDIEIKIFSNDTKQYINPNDGYFQINEKTPMLYGFSIYEKECKGCIKFDEVVIRMLRGEHLANPKIRKHILGY